MDVVKRLMQSIKDGWYYKIADISAIFCIMITVDIFNYYDNKFLFMSKFLCKDIEIK